MKQERKTGISVSDDILTTFKDYCDNFSHFEIFIKNHISEEIDQVKLLTKIGLETKDYAYDKLNKANNELRLELERREEEENIQTEKVEHLVKVFKIKAKTQQVENQKLQEEIKSLEDSGNFLKCSIESLEKDKVRNHLEMSQLKHVLSQQLEKVSFYKQSSLSLETEIGTLKMENDDDKRC